MRKQPSQDQYRVKTDEERRYYQAGIPYDFWHYDSSPIAFENIQRPSGVVSTMQIQQKNFQAFSNDQDVWLTNSLVVIASQPTDQRARSISFALIKLAIARGFRIQIDAPHRVDEVDSEQVFLLDGVYDNPTVETRWPIRQWVRERESRFRVISVAGTVVNFVDNYGLWPDVGFQVAENDHTFDEWV